MLKKEKIVKVILFNLRTYTLNNRDFPRHFFAKNAA